MSNRRKSPARAVIEFERLLAADAGLRMQHEVWIASGYECTGARLWRCRDGRFTARLVWRNRAAVVSTVTCTVQGLVL